MINGKWTIGVLGAILLGIGCADRHSSNTGNSDYGQVSIQALTVGSPAVVRVAVNGQGFASEITTQLSQSGSAWGGIIGKVPAGAQREFQVGGYDEAGQLLYSGLAVTDIDADTSLNLMIFLIEVNAGTLDGNLPPVINYLTMSANQVAPGKTIQLAVAAEDADGSIESYSWSASAGTFTEQSQAQTVYTAPQQTGVQTIRLTIGDNHGGTAGVELKVDVQTYYDDDSTAVDIDPTQLPSIQGISTNPGQLTEEEATIHLTVNVVGSSESFNYQWSKQAGTGCTGTFGDTNGDFVAGNESSTAFTAAAEAVETVGTCTFSVDVQVKGGEGTSTQTITVARGEIDLPPVISVEFQSDNEATPGQMLTFRVKASDPEGAEVAYEWASAYGSLGTPVDIIVGGQKVGERLVWTAPDCAVGPMPIQVTVSDGPMGLSTATSFTAITMPTYPCDLTVEPLYSANGAYWTQRIGNDGADILSSSDTECLATGPLSYADCLHGGEMRVMDIPGLDNCTNVTISDYLNAFDWICDDSTATIRAISVGLKQAKGLTDLMDFNGGSFLTNSIQVQVDGDVYLNSPPTIWWDNPVELIDGSTTFDTDYTVYLAATNQALSIDFASTVGGSVVVKPGIVYTGDGIDTSHLVEDAAWVEGSYDGLGINNHGLFGCKRVRNVNLYNFHTAFASNTNYDRRENILIDSATYGIFLSSAASGNLFQNIRMTSIGSNAIREVGDRNVFNNVRNDDGASSHTIKINGDDVIVHDFHASNSQGTLLASGDRIILTNVLMNHLDASAMVGAGQDIVLMGYTNFGGAAQSMNITNQDYSMFMNLLFLNGTTGLRIITNLNTTTVADTALLNNDTAIYFESGSGSIHFTGELLLGGNTTNCDIIPASGGIQENGTLCENNNSSNANFTHGLDGSDVVEGIVSDSVNPDGAAGDVLYADIQDHLNFESGMRSWGSLDGLTGVCNFVDTCRIWSFALSASNSTIRAGRPQPVNGDAGSTRSHTFSTGSVDYLVNTQELMLDGIGNDNGLCESNEACLYTPNYGAYQGHGALELIGTINGLVVDNVTLYGYAQNGY